MKKSERMGRTILTVIIAVIVLLILGFCKRFSVNIVLSGSMEPVLKTGGIVFTDKEKKEPEIGDIITYQMENTLVTHRVSGIKGDTYMTKGDANDREDAMPVFPSQILGTVVFFLPYLGYGMAFLRQKTVFALITLMLIQELFFLGIQWKGERTKVRINKSE